MIIKYLSIAIGLLVASNVATVSYYKNKERRNELAYLNEKNKSYSILVKRQLEQNQGILNAFNETTKKIKTINVDISSARDASDRLSESLSQYDRQLSTMSEDAKAVYTSSLSNVFGECVTRYRDLATKADGHTVDINKFLNLYKAE